MIFEADTLFIDPTQMPAARGVAEGYWHLWRANKKAYRTKKICTVIITFST